MTTVMDLSTLYIVTFIAAIHVRLDWALHFDLPRNYNSLLGNDIRISCMLDDKDLGKNVLYMHVGMRGKPPMVTLSSGSTLSFSSNIQPDVKADGHLDKDVSKCYLNVTILKPTSKDTGVYECVIYYVSQDNALQKEHAEAYLKISKPDIPSIEKFLKNLVQMVKLLKHDVTDLKQNVSHVDKENQKLTQQVSELEEENRKMAKQGSVIEDKMTLVEAIERNQSRLINDLTDEDSEIENRLTLMERMDRNQSRLISALTDKATYSCGFVAARNGRNVKPLVSGETVEFPEVSMQLGADGYNSTTGIFTAPKDGLYIFHLTGETSCPDCSLEFEIRANKKVIGMLQISVRYEMKSVSSVTVLHVGDQVKTVNNHAKGQSRNDLYASFSGYLVKLL